MAASSEQGRTDRSRSRSPPGEGTRTAEAAPRTPGAAPGTPDPLTSRLQALERKVDRLVNDLARTEAYWRNRHTILDAQLSEMSAQMDELRDKRELSSAGGGNPNWGSAEVQVFGMIFIASMCFG